MARVFISYRRTDAIDIAFAISDALQRSGIEVWMDLSNLPPSISWLEEIKQAIRGSSLLLIVNSPQRHLSGNCEIEVQVAREWSVPSIDVDAATVSPDIALQWVRAALTRRTAADLLRTELFDQAGYWAHNGEPPRALAGGRKLRAYRRLVREHSSTFPMQVNRFIGVSRRRQRRLSTLRWIGVMLAFVLVFTGVLIQVTFDMINDEIDDATVSFDSSAALVARYRQGPYQHLDELATNSGVGWIYDYAFAKAFAETLPAAVHEPGPEAAARVADGAIGRTTLVSPDTALTANLTGTTNITITDSRGGLVRTLTAAGEPHGMAWSPDGSRLLVGTGTEVEVLDVVHGTASRRLRGSPDTVVGIAVTDTEVHARTRTGELIVVDAAARAEIMRIDVGVSPDAATGLVLEQTGSTVAVSSVSAQRDQNAIVTIDLRSRQRQRFSIDACVPAQFTYSPSSQRMYLACQRQGLGTLDLSTGRFTLTALNASATSVAVSGDTIAVGTSDGRLLRLDIDTLRIRGDKSLGCSQSISPLSVSADGNYLLHGGSAAAKLQCANRIDIAVQGAPHSSFVIPDQQGQHCRAVTTSPDGTLAVFGFSDGTVRAYTLDEYGPTSIHHPFTGEVRGLVFDRGGTTLIAVSRDGDVVAMDMRADRVPLQSKRTAAAQLVDQAIALGLYRR